MSNDVYAPIEQADATTTEEIDNSEDLNSEQSDDDAMDAGEPTEVPSRKYKVKIDNEESEVDEAELIKGYQLSKASHQRMQQAAELQKELESFVHEIKANPLMLLDKLGVSVQDLVKQSGLSHKEILKTYGDDIYDIAAGLLQEQIEDAMLSPEAKKARDYDKLMAEKQAEKDHVNAEANKKANQAAMLKAEQDVQLEIVQALKEGGLKPTRELIAQVAYEMAMQIDSGNNPTAHEILKTTSARDKNKMMAFIKALPQEVLEEIMPPEYIENLNKQRVEKLQGGLRKPEGEKKPSKEKRQYKSLKELGL